MQLKPSNHPATLSTFFATELWERYGFYVVQTLLALYLALYFKWEDNDVYALIGSFTALTYLSPVVGGWIADHVLGQKRTIFVGGMVLLASYLGLTWFSDSQWLVCSLAGLVVGTGLLKPNISSLLGNEYDVGSPHREKGFLIFYMGITMGIVLGTTIPSYLNAHYGWPVSFLSAALGILLCLITFAVGIVRYRIPDYFVHTITMSKVIFSAVLLASLWVVSFYILSYPKLADGFFLMGVFLSIGYFFYCVRYEKKTQARQTLVIGLLCLISVMFWAFYFQMFMSLTLFIVRVVKPTLWGIGFPPPYYVGVQSVGMLILGILLLRRKVPLNQKAQSISTGNKFLSAMLSTTAAYGLITLVCYWAHTHALLSPLWIIPAYLLISFAEMMLSPVGLSAVTMLASRNKVSTFMGIFLASIGLGAYVSGKLAKLTSLSTEEVLRVDLKAHYATTFGHLFLILLVATLTCVLINYFIRRLIQQ